MNQATSLSKLLFITLLTTSHLYATELKNLVNQELSIKELSVQVVNVIEKEQKAICLSKANMQTIRIFKDTLKYSRVCKTRPEEENKEITVSIVGSANLSQNRSQSTKSLKTYMIKKVELTVKEVFSHKDDFYEIEGR